MSYLSRHRGFRRHSVDGSNWRRELVRPNFGWASVMEFDPTLAVHRLERGQWVLLHVGAVPVYRVTNGQASGEGSLQWALDQPGPRIVVSDYEGIVSPGTTIKIWDNSDLYADLRGITLVGNGVDIRGTAGNPAIARIFIRGLRIIAPVRNQRSRFGDDEPCPNLSRWTGDGVDVANAEDVFLDQITVVWAADEAFSAETQAVERLTITRSLVIDPLRYAHEDAILVPGSDHSRAGNLVAANQVLMWRNVICGANWRNPQVAQGGEYALVGNVIALWGERGLTYDSGALVYSAYNTFRPGAWTTGAPYRCEDSSPGESQLFIEGDVLDGGGTPGGEGANYAASLVGAVPFTLPPMPPLGLLNVGRVRVGARTARYDKPSRWEREYLGPPVGGLDRMDGRPDLTNYIDCATGRGSLP